MARSNIRLDCSIASTELSREHLTWRVEDSKVPKSDDHDCFLSVGSNEDTDSVDESSELVLLAMVLEPWHEAEVEHSNMSMSDGSPKVIAESDR